MALRACLLGSGSNGNATFVATGRVRVLFDAGLSCLQIRKRLAAVGEDYAALDAVVLSHEHSDHVKGVEVLQRQTGVEVFATRLTWSAVRWKKQAPAVRTFAAGNPFSIGDLDIESFTISHDAIDPVGFNARSRGSKLSIVTDLGYVTDSVRHHLTGSDLLVLESNHDLEMLKTGPYPWEVKQRVKSRDGHLSNSDAAEYLSRDWDRAAKTVVLAHLSEHNNHPAIAEMDASAALEAAGARRTQLVVARQDAPTAMFEI